MAENNVSIIDRLINQQNIDEEKPRRFLAAWKNVVTLIGPELFEISAKTVDAAVDKEQLRPDLNSFVEQIGVMSSGEQIFAIAAYQMFCDSDSSILLQASGLKRVSLADIANLDEKRRHVIFELVDSYTGW